jgi:hypothetical protein
LYLLRVILEGQKADPSENGLKSCSSNVTPVEHPVKFAAIDEITFERREEYLRRVTEDDNTQGYGELLHVDAPLDLCPSPISNLENAVAEYDGIDEQMGDCAPEAQ